jgi:hypothetical protein
VGFEKGRGPSEPDPAGPLKRVALVARNREPSGNRPGVATQHPRVAAQNAGRRMFERIGRKQRADALEPRETCPEEREAALSSKSGSTKCPLARFP